MTFWFMESLGQIVFQLWKYIRSISGEKIRNYKKHGILMSKGKGAQISHPFSRKIIFEKYKGQAITNYMELLIKSKKSFNKLFWKIRLLYINLTEFVGTFKEFIQTFLISSFYFSIFLMHSANSIFRKVSYYNKLRYFLNDSMSTTQERCKNKEGSY